MKPISCAPLLGALLLTCGAPWAQARPASTGELQLDVTTSWIGNDFGYAKGRHVQNNAQFLWVKPDDGTLYVGSAWDEGHRAGGIYRGGDVIGSLADTFQDFLGAGPLTGDARYVYAARGGGLRRYNFDGARAPFEGGPGGDIPLPMLKKLAGDARKIRLSVSAIAANPRANRLYVAVSAFDEKDALLGSELQCFDVADGIKFAWVSEDTSAIRSLAIAPDGAPWAILPPVASTGEFTGAPFRLAKFAIREQNGQLAAPPATAVATQVSSAFAADQIPVAMNFDAKGRLMVADNGPDQNIKIYDVSGAPKLSGTFGEKGGIFAGPRAGVPGEKRFQGLTGVGSDAAGNVYVTCNRFGPVAGGFSTSGALLDAYAPGGKRLWHLRSLEFVDVADVDAASIDGDKLDVYTKLARYSLDLSQPVGQQWTYAGTLIDALQYPDDERVKRVNNNFSIPAGAWIRNVAGRKWMVVTTMMSDSMPVYRFEPNSEIAIPAGFLPMSGAGGALNLFHWVDSKGDAWANFHGQGIHHFPFAGYNAKGEPTWGADQFDTGGVEHLGLEVYRLEYDPQTDVMICAGYAPDVDPNHRWQGPNFSAKAIGSVVARYDKWSQGNRKATWVQAVHYGNSSHDAPVSMSVAGDYLFLGYENLFDDDNSGRIRAYRLSDGAFVGTLHGGPEIGDLVGAMDVAYGVRAFQRASGEYLIFSEEDWHAKVLMYRWTPPKTAPAAPTDVRAQAGNGAVALHWTGAPGAANYRIEAAANAGGPFEILGRATNANFTDTGAANGVARYYRVSAGNAAGDGALSSAVSATPDARAPIRINSGGAPAGEFGADANFSGGQVARNDAAVDVSAPGSAPVALYQGDRFGAFSYRFRGLTPGAPFRLKLHFAEDWWGIAGRGGGAGAGQRLQNVSANGQTLLQNFDVFAVAGAGRKAVVREFAVKADDKGEIALEFAPTPGSPDPNTLVNGLELLPQ